MADHPSLVVALRHQDLVRRQGIPGGTELDFPGDAQGRRNHPVVAGTRRVAE
jgi:hypothetical protein